MIPVPINIEDKRALKQFLEVLSHDLTKISKQTNENISLTEVEALINQIITSRLKTAIEALTAQQIKYNNEESHYSSLNVQAVIDEHIARSTDVHDASAISNVAAGTIEATDVQSAINELDGDIQAHIDDTIDAHDASAISYSNTTSGIEATDVQSAINELSDYGILVVSVTANHNAAAKNQNILCNATGGNIIITLPNPASSFVNNRSKMIGITKTDATANTVTIAPNSTELVAGEANQILSYSNEVLNFITDGTNWHLGA